MKSKTDKSVKIVIVCMLLGSITPLYAAIPPLHVDGNQIKDPNGKVVVLRGICLLDLGSLESWQGGAINMINRLTNKSDAQGGSPGWYTKVVRIPICPADSHTDTWPYEFNPDDLNDPNNTALYNLLRSVVNQCALKDVYSIIDWHYVANTYDHVA
ncbi:MAG: glycoside hydrolase family 5 protein, partial [Sedimentisphaerales bacterium]|nr:glycoside hydrolase family 5 protein [Sedimentisphaerales bacterium]